MLTVRPHALQPLTAITLHQMEAHDSVQVSVLFTQLPLGFRGVGFVWHFPHPSVSEDVKK